MSYELELIKARTEEVGDCWIWQQGVSDGGYPIMKAKGRGCCLVRRLVVELTGRKLKPRQPVGVSCDERLCVNPEHLQPTTTSAIAQKAADRGAFSTLARGAKIAVKRREAAGVKLTIGQAREIRMSTESGPILAERYGVNKSLINSIKRGTAWREYQGNPFAALMAANDAARRRA